MIQYQTYSGPERLLRALGALLTCWLLGAVSLLIPVLHFATVPTMFFVGLYLAWFRGRHARLASAAEGLCSGCGAAVRIPLRSVVHFPHWDFCPQCEAHVRIEASRETAS